jgi:hypothetical protein
VFCCVEYNMGSLLCIENFYSCQYIIDEAGLKRHAAQHTPNSRYRYEHVCVCVCLFVCVCYK